MSNIAEKMREIANEASRFKPDSLCRIIERAAKRGEYSVRVCLDDMEGSSNQIISWLEDNGFRFDLDVHDEYTEISW